MTAKTKNDIRKVTFGERKGGRSRKTWGPKDSHRKKYRGQGRKR
jgi:hypothetical protein